MEKNRNPYKKNFHLKKLQVLAPWLLLAAFVAFIVTLVIFLLVVPEIFRWRIKMETQLVNGSETWEKWYNITVPVYYRIYVFNITNPDALEKGEKFKLQQLGPYYYEEKRLKKILSIDEEEDTITYEERIHYFFRPDLSQGNDEEDTVTTIDLAYLSLATIGSQYLSLFSNFLTSAIDALDDGVIKKNVKVRELIFTGYEIDPMYAWLSSFRPVRGTPTEFSGDRFAYMNTVNGSIVAIFKIKRGLKDSETFGQIVTFDGKNQTDFWPYPAYAEDQQFCNQVNGSDGSIYPPFRTKESLLYIYSKIICRSLSFKFDKEVNYHGIPGYQFRLPRKIFSHPSKTPGNECYCQNPGGGLKHECMDGAQRLFNCKSDSPLVLSKPHFLDGALSFVDAVEGLRPNRYNHGSYLQIEPRTGMLLNISVKMQISAELQPFPMDMTMQNIPHVIVPVFWLEEGAYLEQSDIDFLMKMLIIPSQVLEGLQWTLLSTLGAVLMIGLFLWLKKDFTQKTTY